MVATSSSSSSSCASFGSFDDVTVKLAAAGTIKFLCSYGGKILPRYPDGKLRYVGGDTRVLAVDRSVSFSDLQLKLKELCGWESVNLRCQLPTEDLDDALISITSDEDLANLIGEYDLASRDRVRPLKIRAFLLPPPASPPPKPASSSAASSSSSAKGGNLPSYHFHPSQALPPFDLRCVHHTSVPARVPNRMEKPHSHQYHHHHYYQNHSNPRPYHFLVHHGGHC
ncbi:uncharacterized protein [Typha angustifolia]|uniref:uncharacterized protein n=1 Tax=Typha angustifolia TaxID=59011 RepID=UPI003C2D8AEE